MWVGLLNSPKERGAIIEGIEKSIGQKPIENPKPRKFPDHDHKRYLTGSIVSPPLKLTQPKVVNNKRGVTYLNMARSTHSYTR